MRNKFLALIVVVIASIFAAPVFTAGQTQHGVLVSWTVPAIPTGGAAIAGYYAFRQTYTSGACSGGVQISAGLITGTSILDPASGLSTSTEYCYYVQTQDVNGNVSAASNTATITTPAAWPVSPNAPGTPTVKIQ